MCLRATLQAYLSPIELCFPQYLSFKRRSLARNLLEKLYNLVSLHRVVRLRSSEYRANIKALFLPDTFGLGQVSGYETPANTITDVRVCTVKHHHTFQHTANRVFEGGRNQLLYRNC